VKSELSIVHISVIGAGIMGSGIAKVCLAGGFQVRLFDPNPEALRHAESRITKNGQAKEDLLRLDVTGDLKVALENTDMLIEAAPEMIEIKQQIFRRASDLAPKNAILATNTSQLSVTDIASVVESPHNVVGMHWFNPPERMELVEIVQATKTSHVTVSVTEEVVRRCGKTSVVVADRRGFVVTRAVAASILEGIRIYEEGVAQLEDIDMAIKLGLNHPMGPLELADYIGLDTLLLIADSMTSTMGDRFQAPQVLRSLVKANRLGRKTGRGFYSYDVQN